MVEGNFSKTTLGVQISEFLKDKIKKYVDDFIKHCISHPENIYLVTEIGCGLSGYSPENIAPLFREAKDIENIHLPERFWRYID